MAFHDEIRIGKQQYAGCADSHAATPLIATLALLTFEFFPRLFSGPLISAVGKPEFNLVGIALQIIIVVIGMLLLGRMSFYGAAAIWVLRAVLTTPVEMWMLKRATGLNVRAQIRGLPLLLLCTVGMGLAVLAVGRVGADWQPLAKLSAMVAVGAMSYPLLLWFTNRSLLRRLFAFAGEIRRSSI